VFLSSFAAAADRMNAKFCHCNQIIIAQTWGFVLKFKYEEEL
jgi:hypothetical protein